MSSRCLEKACAALALALLTGAAAAEPLRVCADVDAPAFEDRLAALLAGALQRPLQTLRAPWRHGFVRKTEGLCEVFVGVPAGFGPLLTTRPYGRAGWVAVTRRADRQPLAGLNDARLAQLRIGIVLPAGDGGLTPVGQALLQRGALQHVQGYPVAARPVLQMLQDLQAGTLDAALLWAPQAAAADRGQFAVAPLSIDGDVDVAVGVRRGHPALLADLQRALDQRRDDIDALLADAGLAHSGR